MSPDQPNVRREALDRRPDGLRCGLGFAVGRAAVRRRHGHGRRRATAKTAQRAVYGPRRVLMSISFRLGWLSPGPTTRITRTSQIVLIRRTASPSARSSSARACASRRMRPEWMFCGGRAVGKEPLPVQFTSPIGSPFGQLNADPADGDRLGIGVRDDPVVLVHPGDGHLHRQRVPPAGSCATTNAPSSFPCTVRRDPGVGTTSRLPASFPRHSSASLTTTSRWRSVPAADGHRDRRRAVGPSA